MQKDSDISYIDNEYGIYIADISDIVERVFKEKPQQSIAVH